MRRLEKQSSERTKAKNRNWSLLCSIARTAGLVFPVGILAEAVCWLVSRKAPDSLWRIAVDLSIISLAFGVLEGRRQLEVKQREYKGTDAHAHEH